MKLLTLQGLELGLGIYALPATKSARGCDGRFGGGNR